jgi:uncharacterized membrane protein
MKKYFLTGFISLLPIALTLLIVRWLFELFTAPLAGIMEWWLLKYELRHHDTLVFFLSRILAFIFLVVLIFLLGFCGQKFLTKYFGQFTHRLLSRIPIIGFIYRLSYDVTKAIFSNTKKTFKQTVLLPFPHQDALAIGFITGDVPLQFQQETPLTQLAVFMPTAPHPMSGFVLLMPKNLVRPVDVSVEDAFKFLISAGVLHPGDKMPPDKTPDNL